MTTCVVDTHRQVNYNVSENKELRSWYYLPSNPHRVCPKRGLKKSPFGKLSKINAIVIIRIGTPHAYA